MEIVTIQQFQTLLWMVILMDVILLGIALVRWDAPDEVPGLSLKRCP